MTSSHFIDPANPLDGLRIYKDDKKGAVETGALAFNETFRKISKAFYSLGIAGGTWCIAQALTGGEQSVSTATATVCSTLIGYGLSTYLNGPEADTVTKIWEASIAHELKDRIDHPGKKTSSVASQISCRIVDGLIKMGCLAPSSTARQLIQQHAFEKPSTFRRELGKTLLRLAAKPMNLAEMYRETVMIWKQDAHPKEKYAKYHNFFAQRSQFEVNIAHLSALMASKEPDSAAQVFHAFESEDMQAFLKEAPSILPFFQENNISLKRMLSVFREAIGPDAAYLFGKEDLSVYKLQRLMRPLLSNVVALSARHAEIHNMSMMLLDMAEQLDANHPEGLNAKDACSVVNHLKELLVDKEESHHRFNVNAVEPNRSFKHAGLLKACDAFLMRYGKGVVPTKIEPRDLAALLFPNASDNPYVETELWAPNVDGVLEKRVFRKEKSIAEAHAIGMSEAIKDAIRNAPTVYQRSEVPLDAINIVTSRIMMKVFLLATQSGRNVGVKRETEKMTAAPEPTSPPAQPMMKPSRR